MIANKNKEGADPSAFVSRWLQVYWQDLRKVELEVELPCAGILRDISVFVCKGNAQLDHLEQIDIAAQSLIMIVGRGAKVAYE